MNYKLNVNSGKKMKNLVNWEIEFKKRTGELDKIEAMNAIEKYIITHFFNKYSREFLLTSATFNFPSGSEEDKIQITFTPGIAKPNTKPALSGIENAAQNSTGIAASGTPTSTVIPTPPPPKREWVHLSRFIKIIRQIA